VEVSVFETMKSSPYGVFTGQLFQYCSSPSLIAFESSPPSSLGQTLSQSTCNKKCILLGGLSDGPIPTPYTKQLEQSCHTQGWSLVQPILSSSYLGFGHGSLARDTNEIVQLLEYLIEHHNAEHFAFVGHSTGCQNSIHLLKYGRLDIIQRIKAVVLQAPVSDRESLPLSSIYGCKHNEYIQHAQSLLAKGAGEEMMPRSVFWAPITANRYLSLFSTNGDDDYFSSDLTDVELHERLGHVGKLGRTTGMHVLVAYSKQDEYVPKSIDKQDLLQRLVNAMNDFVVGDNVVGGIMLPHSNHNLSNNENDQQSFVDMIEGMLYATNLETDGK
jgi:pimeloyl-ACP methyl ester carboxylesterase